MPLAYKGFSTMPLAYITHASSLRHIMGPEHPEQPDRIRVIEEAIFNSELKDDMRTYEAPKAILQQIQLAHDKNYVEYIIKNSPKKGLISLDPDTAMNPDTLEAALHAAGANILAVDLVMTGQHKVVFCNIRPPGHHAEWNQAMGFCFFNNVAIGVLYALEKYQIERIAIIDFDVHHGNGTENIFFDNKKMLSSVRVGNTAILLCSSFQYPFYPYPDISRHRPHVLNVPLPPGTTGKAYRESVNPWFSAIKNFKPQLIYCSAGFDAHSKDMLANIFLETADYSWLSQQIKEIADQYCEGRIISSLEGGYCLSVLGECAVAHLTPLVRP